MELGYLLQRPKFIREHFPSYSSRALCNGQVLLLSLFSALLILDITFYIQFKQFIFDGNLNASEKALAATGEILNMILGLLLLPSSRNSVWCIAVGISHQNILNVHKV